MASYDSPIGKKQIKGPPMKEFSVSDESGPQPPQHRHIQEQQLPPFDPRALREFEASQRSPVPQVREMSEIEQQIFQAKKAKREGKERLSEGARRRIEMLVGMTRLIRDIDIGGNIYRVQTLSSRELRDALTATIEFDGTVEFIFETRKQLLARALTMVAGLEISQFLNSQELEDRLEFIEEMDHALLVRLYNEYTTMNQEAQDKYAIKTETQVKEVLEDLKK